MQHMQHFFTENTNVFKNLQANKSDEYYMDEKYQQYCQQYCQDCPEMPRKHISTKKQIKPDQQLPSVSQTWSENPLV
jgi:hypothetical protein